MSTHGLDADQVGEIAALRQQGSSMDTAIIKVGRTRTKEGVLENSEPLEAAMEAAIKRIQNRECNKARKMAKDKPEELAANPALERKFVNSHLEQVLCFGSCTLLRSVPAVWRSSRNAAMDVSALRVTHISAPL